MRNYLLHKETAVKIFILVFYLVGVTGLLVPATHHFFTLLTPLSILLSAFLLALFHPEKFSRKVLAVFAAICLMGFIIEVAGVQSGIIFGNYQYGNSLGFKLFGTPLIIGLNWLMLVYLTSSVLGKFHISSNWKVVFASLLMLLYDLLLEIVAPKMDMWSWSGEMVSLRNYVAWFTIALLFHRIIKFFGIQTDNKLSVTILSVQFVFFLLLATLL